MTTYLLEELGIDRFEFQRQYGGLFHNKDCKFVLREEHIANLKRLAAEFNEHRFPDTPPLSASDIVNACLDLMFEHPLDLKGMRDPDAVRQVIAKEVYRKAFTRFQDSYEMF